MLGGRRAGAHCIGATACSRERGGDNPSKRTFSFPKAHYNEERRGKRNPAKGSMQTSAHTPQESDDVEMAHTSAPVHTQTCVWYMYIHYVYPYVIIFHYCNITFFFCDTLKRGGGKREGVSRKKNTFHHPSEAPRAHSAVTFWLPPRQSAARSDTGPSRLRLACP